MTAREGLKTIIRQDGEPKTAWFERVAKYVGCTAKQVQNVYYMRNGREMVETQVKYNGKDEVISRTEKLQDVNFIEPTEDMELSRLSTNNSTSQQWKIYTKKSQDKAIFRLNKEIVEQSIKELNLKPLDVVKIKPSSNKVLKVTYTDAHVGLNITENLYGLRNWNEDELFKSLKRIVQVVKSKFNSHSKIVVADYGDFMDGLDGQTTRKGHLLDQNMSNEEAFKVGTRFKIELAKELAQFGVPLEFYSVTNDNHSGSFSEIVNYHVQQVLSYILPEVKYIYFKDFISHYFINDWCFICTHGKDSKHMKFGFNTKPDDKSKTHINAYIDKHNLHNYRIVFEMGDKHQLIRDNSQYKFEYNVYFALSPASDWVQTNFGKGVRGFAVEEIEGDLKSFLPVKMG